jgi:hypothetical protein
MVSRKICVGVIALLLGLTGCTSTPYYQDKEIVIESRRCDPSGCLDKVRFKEGNTPSFEISPDRIQWKTSNPRRLGSS